MIPSREISIPADLALFFKVLIRLALLVLCSGLAGFLLTPSTALAQPVPVLERAAVERHLRQSAVDGLFQDRDGFLWIGTREGLVRWDGFRARYWHNVPFDQSSLQSNMVSSIDQDATGHLWLITKTYIHGDSRIERLVAPAFDRVVTYGLSNAEVVLDHAQRPWVVSREGVLRYLADEDRFETWIALDRRRPPAHRPTSGIDSRHSLWVLGQQDLLRCDLDKRRCAAVPVPSTGPYFRMWLDQERLIVTNARAAHCLNLSDADGRGADPNSEPVIIGRWRPCFEPRVDGFETPVGITRDSAGHLWLATPRGVWREAHGGLQRVALPSGSGAGFDDIYALLSDHAGGLWAGSPWGLLRWDPFRQPFELMGLGEDIEDPQPSEARPSTAAPILSLHEDEEGTLWIGTIGDGVHSRSAAGVWQHWPLSIRSSPAGGSERGAFAGLVWAITSRGPWVWFSLSSGALRLDRRTGLISVLDVPLPAKQGEVPFGVRRILAEEDGSLWILTYANGLWHFEPEGGQRQVYPGTAEDFLITADRRFVVIGTADDGLRILDPQGGEVIKLRHDPQDPNSLSGQGVISLWQDGLRQDGQARLWLGTTGGLDRLSLHDLRIEHVLGPRDLPSSTVLSILEGPRRLWLGTNRGLVSIDKTKVGSALSRGLSLSELPGAVAIWDHRDGIGNLELNRGSALLSRDGHMLFGGDRGITRFDPTAIQPSPLRPTPRLETWTVITRRGLRRLDPQAGQPTKIGPTVTGFTVELTTIDFSSPSRNRFAVRLVGLDPDWIELGLSRSATYAGVPPGRYTLQAKVSNADGVWTPELLEIPVVVVPPFYRRADFLSAIALVAIGLVLATGMLWTRRKYLRRLEALRIEHGRQEERRRISRDLHDELGAGLTQIVLLSERERLRQEPADPKSAPAFGQIADQARRLIQGIREILWSVDPEQDRFDLLCARIRGSSAELLEAAGLRAELDFPEHPPDIAVSPKLRRNVSLMVREALNNAVRHAEAQTVRVSLTLEQGQIRLEIHDDGRGFMPSEATGDPGRTGRGLTHLHRRANELGGTVDIVSHPGEGTRIKVRLPI